MTTILIRETEITTQGGHSAVIIGIDPTDEDCVIGEINSRQVRWNRSGICRGQSSGANILPQDDDFKEVIQTIDLLSGKS